MEGKNTTLLIDEPMLIGRRRLIQAKINEKFRKQYNLALLDEKYWTVRDGYYGDIYGGVANPPYGTIASVTYADGTTKTNVPWLEFGDFGIKILVDRGVPGISTSNSWIAMNNLPSNIKKIIVKLHVEKLVDGYETNPWMFVGSSLSPVTNSYYNKPTTHFEYTLYEREFGRNLNELASADIYEIVNVTEDMLTEYNSYRDKSVGLEVQGGYIWLKEFYIQLTDGSYWTPQ